MTETFDAIVVGAGVVGASTAFHLAKLGGLKVCVVERGQVCSGGTAKSCAIVRSHYSVPSNTALTLRSLEMFGAFADWLEAPDAESGFVNPGYLIVASDGDFAGAAPRANWVGPYDITPDWNPVLGPAPGVDGLMLAFGFSGYGFKLAPAVGLTLAEQVLRQDMDVDIGAYGLERFQTGKLLIGAYGVGSIS